MSVCYNGPWDHETEVIVVGFGGAGGCAAIEAHNTGAKVMLLEKQPENHHYSNTRMSGGSYHCPDPNGDREALKAYAKAMFSGDNIPWKFEGEEPDYSDGLAELWAELAPTSGDFMMGLDPDYLGRPSPTGAAFPHFPGADKAGYRTFESTYIHESTQIAFQGNPRDPKHRKVAGDAFHACILHGVTERKIPVHYDTRVRNFLFNNEGVVIGVKAEQGDKEVFYRAKKAVVITSGGYEYNRQLRMAFLSGPGVDGWAFYGTPANTGDGIIMAMEAGAALSKVSNASARLIASFPNLRSGGIRKGVAIPSIGRTHDIIVDNEGNRYLNEHDIIIKGATRYNSYNHALQFDIHRTIYPHLPSWYIFDDTLFKAGKLTSPVITDFHDVPWSADNHEALENGWVLKGETLEELAEKIKNHPDNKGLMNAENLENSVTRYNQFCADGEDKDFHRDQNSPLPQKTLLPLDNPPYYALPLVPGGPNTKGGLRANEKRQLVDWEGNVIPRLYAAGEIASVFKFVYNSGGNVGECIVCGRAAGRNAALEAAID